MKKGFSLVELLVVVTVSLVLISGALVYIGSFSIRQKLNTTREEVVANLRLARSYAMAYQPVGGEALKYVEVSFEDGVMEVVANKGMASETEYFSKEIGDDQVAVESDGSLLFLAYEGKLVRLNGSSLESLGVDEKIIITITVTDKEVYTDVIEVKSSGLIE